MLRRTVKLRSFSDILTTYITSQVVTTHIERTKDNKPLATRVQVLDQSGTGDRQRMTRKDLAGLDWSRPTPRLLGDEMRGALPSPGRRVH